MLCAATPPDPAIPLDGLVVATACTQRRIQHRAYALATSRSLAKLYNHILYSKSPRQFNRLNDTGLMYTVCPANPTLPGPPSAPRSHAAHTPQRCPKSTNRPSRQSSVGLVGGRRGVNSGNLAPCPLRTIAVPTPLIYASLAEKVRTWGGGFT